MKKIPKTAIFRYILKNQHIHFWVRAYFSWSMFGLHLVKGPKASKMQFLEIRPWKCDHENCPFRWDNFIVHDINNPLYVYLERSIVLSIRVVEGHFTHETERPWPLHFKHSHWWKRWSGSKFASHYAWGTNIVCECEMDVKTLMDSYMALNGLCFMVTWIISKNHLLDVGLTQNQKVTTLWTITTVDLVYSIMYEDPYE